MKIFTFRQYNKRGIKGFTLVELLVVLGLFSSVMTLATGALYTSQAVNTKLQETQSILDNANLSMEVIARDIRYGSDFYCTSEPLVFQSNLKRRSCPYSKTSTSTYLYFKPASAITSDDRVGYYLANSVLMKDEYTNGVRTTYQITSNDVTVKSLIFYVTGAQTSDASNDVDNVSDYDQPLITLSFTGVTKPTKSKVIPVSFTMQTTVAARELDR